MVKNDEQADIVFRAMAHYTMPLLQITQKGPKLIEGFWKIFVEAVRKRRWDYLIEMEKYYWKSIEATLIPIGICPHCGNKLNTEHINDLGVLQCIPCRKSYRLPS